MISAASSGVSLCGRVTSACSLPRYDEVIGGGVVGTEVPPVFEVGIVGPADGPPRYGSPAPWVRFVVQPKAASVAMSANASKFLFLNVLRMSSPFESTGKKLRLFRAMSVPPLEG
jgi:hypothetical protein